MCRVLGMSRGSIGQKRVAVPSHSRVANMAATVCGSLHPRERSPSCRTTEITTAAEKAVVVVPPELVAQEVQRQRIDARVQEAQAKSDDLKNMPEQVIHARIIMVP